MRSPKSAKFECNVSNKFSNIIPSKTITFDKISYSLFLSARVQKSMERDRFEQEVARNLRTFDSTGIARALTMSAISGGDTHWPRVDTWEDTIVCDVLHRRIRVRGCVVTLITEGGRTTTTSSSSSTKKTTPRKPPLAMRVCVANPTGAGRLLPRHPLLSRIYIAVCAPGMGEIVFRDIRL